MFEVSKLSGRMLCERVAEAMRRNKPSTVVMGVGLPGSTSGCGRALLSRFGSVNSLVRARRRGEVGGQRPLLRTGMTSAAALSTHHSPRSLLANALLVREVQAQAVG